MRLLTGDPFPDLFGRARHHCFHLETRDSYLVDDEAEPLHRFLAGKPAVEPPDEWREWGDLIEATTQRGVAVERVRIVSVPHSDYVRWLLSITDVENIAVGETVRWLPRHLAALHDAAADDFWLIDDALVAYNATDSAGAPCGVAVTEDPALVTHAVLLRSRVWPQAIDHAVYVNEYAAHTPA
ncbi:DUF6879 family protein [Nocardia sp. NPDC004711]